MLARWLRALLITEAVLYSALVALGMSDDGLSLPTALSVIAVLALALRLGPTGRLFWLSRRAADRIDHDVTLSVSARVRLFFSEGWALTRLYGDLQAFPRPLSTDGDDAPDQLPVLFVHGYACNAGFWRPLTRYLARRGVRSLHTLTLEPVFTPLDRFVDPLHERIEACCRSTGQARLRLVAHSMGGLVARRYLQRYGEARVERLITLGTPHQGTTLAGHGAGANAREMEPDSDWLQALNRTASTVPTFSCYSLHDTLVAPQSYALLADSPHARNVSLGSVGHLAMALSPKVHACVADLLERQPEGRP